MLEDPGRDARLAGLPRLEVVLGVDPAGGQRGQHVRPPVVDLDRDVVVADEVAEAVGDLVEDADRVERGQDRLGDLEELALVAELPLEGGRALAQQLGRVGVDERLGGEAGVDLEQAQVVVGELVEAELGQDEDADDLVVVGHRREEHRLGQVLLGARDGLGPRVVRGVGQDLGDPVGRDPAGDPDPDLDPELLGRLVDVLADLALERDRHEIVAVDPVDPDVVVVDEVVELGRDGHPDLGRAGQPVQAAAELLDRLELRGPGRHPGDVGRRRRAVVDARLRAALRRRRSRGWPAVRAVGADEAAGRRRAAVDGRPDRRPLGRIHEPLQIAEPVAAVAARIDPVIAQPALIAPRPDGVRVDAEQSSRLGHAKGRIRRPFDEQRWQVFMRKCELTRSAYGTSQFLSIGRTYARPERLSVHVPGGSSPPGPAVSRT